MPDIQFFKSMHAEHCTKSGCDVEFKTTNYHIMTTPRREWAIAVEGVALSSGEDGHGRKVLDISSLRSLQISSKAGLDDSEIYSLLLYTGPMVRCGALALLPCHVQLM